VYRGALETYKSRLAGMETSQSRALTGNGGGERFMTVREVAAVLAVSHDTITRKVRELFPGTVRDGVTTYLSEEQVTAVKMAITSQLTSITPTQNCVGVSRATTSLEKHLIIQQAMRFQNEIIIDLEAEIAELKTRASENASAPKADT
jgi:hypothetical protein